MRVGDRLPGQPAPGAAPGFVYLAVVLDWFSRRVLSWRVSITMEAAFCIETLEDALASHGKPEIFNTDQGSQFTGSAFTGVLFAHYPYAKPAGRTPAAPTQHRQGAPAAWLETPHALKEGLSRTIEYFEKLLADHSAKRLLAVGAE